MKKVYLVFAFLIMAGLAMGQTLENPRTQFTKMKVSSPQVDLPKFAFDATKGADTIGYGFFNLFFDANEYYLGPTMAEHISISGTPYGCVNRIYQEYYFSEVELADPGYYQINEVVIYFAQKHKYGATAGTQKVFLNQINADSSYTKLDSASFSIDDVDTTNFFTVIPLPNHAMGGSAISIGLGVKFQDVSFKINNDSARTTVDIMPAAPKMSSFWATDSSAYAFFYDYHQMMPIFLVADNQAGIVGGDNYIEGMQLSQNYPNPSVDGITTISYAVNKEMNVTLQIIDLSGKLVASINEGVKPAGTYQINLSEKLAQGVYYYSLIGNGQFLTKKMIVE